MNIIFSRCSWPKSIIGAVDTIFGHDAFERSCGREAAEAHILFMQFIRCKITIGISEENTIKIGIHTKFSFLQVGDYILTLQRKVARV